MCSLKGFILVSEWLWNDFSYVFLNGFYPRLWEVMEWFLVCVPKWFLSSPLRGYGMISHMCSLKDFILASQRLWNDFLYAIFKRFYPRLSEVVELFFVCDLSKVWSSSLRGYGMISHMYVFFKRFILVSERLWNDISYGFFKRFYPRLWEVMEWFLICVL